MVNKFLASTILSLTAALTCGQVHAAGSSSLVGNLPTQATSPLYKSILYVSQDAPINASAPSLNARVGPLTTSKNGFGMRVNVTNVANASAAIAPMPKIGLAGAQSQENVLAQSKTWMRTYAPSFVQRIAGWMKVRGVSTAYFSAYQEVDVLTDAASGGTKRKGVMWSGTVDLDGRALYGNPRIVDASPVYLSAEYYPLKAGEGVLPEEAAAGYPNAGSIVWKTLNKDLQPLANGPSGVVNVAGAFDEPDDEDGSEVGPLACFIDKRNPACTDVTLSGSGVTDAATLANKIGASGIFAFYARRAEVTSELQSDGVTYAPRLAVSYDERTITCTDISQSVSVGKELQFNGDLYYAQMAQSFYEYSILNRTSRKSAIDPASYSRTASLPTVAAYGMDPMKSLLSPFTEATLPQIYEVGRTDQATLDFLGKVYYIAAINDKRSATSYTSPLDGNTPSNPDSYIYRGAEVATDAGTAYDYRMGFTRRDINTSRLLDGSWTFNVVDKSTLGVFKLTSAYADDHLQVEVNGRVVYNSLGGEMMALGNSAEGAGCGGGMGTRPRIVCQDTGDSSTCWQDGTITEYVAEPAANWYVQFRRDARMEYTYGEVGGGAGDSGGQPGYVMTGSFGCAYAEMNKSSGSALNVDLRPFLQNGSNVIRMKHVIGERGDSEIHVVASAQPSGCADTSGVVTPTSTLSWGLYDRKTKTATFVNDTGAAQPLGAPVQSGSTNFHMSLVSSTCGSSLAAGASCGIPVTFSAANTAEAIHSGAISLSLGGAPKSVRLTGATCRAVNGICP